MKRVGALVLAILCLSQSACGVSFSEEEIAERLFDFEVWPVILLNAGVVPIAGGFLIHRESSEYIYTFPALAPGDIAPLGEIPTGTYDVLLVSWLGSRFETELVVDFPQQLYLLTFPEGEKDPPILKPLP